MKVVRAMAMLGACAAPALAGSARSNPLGKVLELLATLSDKVTQEGEAEAKAYQEYFAWCDDTAKNGQFAIEDGTKQVSKLTATIAKLTGDIKTADTKIADLAGTIATAETELKDATTIREKEAADFAAGENELMETVDILERAVGILQKEMSKGHAALTQIDTSNMANMLQALSVVLDAASFSGQDQKKLSAFVQEQQGASEDDSELEAGAPAAAAYESKSGGIVEVLEDLKDKAEGQLKDLRKAETTSKHNYNMLKQSLDDQLAADNKDMEEQKMGKSASEEARATAEGDLEVASKDLANSTQELETARSTCMQSASDHEATDLARKEELAVIAKARAILEETSGGAAEQSYSFVQLGAGVQNRADLAGAEVVTMVKQLAKKHHSAALAQLASRIMTVVKYSSLGGDDPFGKVKGLISDMILKLEKGMTEEADEKAYCDEQMSKTATKKGELEDDIAKMTAKIDTAASKSAQLQEEVKGLQSELAALAKEQAELDKIRQASHANYEEAKADLGQGLSGVRKALGVLRDYYGGGDAAFVQDEAKFTALMQQPAMPEKHSKSEGAGQSIIGILEVVESDFATNLAKEETEEEDAQSSYDKMTQENKVTTVAKEQDAKYKVQESKSLDTTIAEVSADRGTSNTELAAVDEYNAKIKDRCVAKPETYEDRKAKREAEISGLKQALSVLEDESAFLQRKRHAHRSFRGSALIAQ